ncbi:MAG: hypothetical protein ABJN40_21505 [Sneathiella sp.]
MLDYALTQLVDGPSLPGLLLLLLPVAVLYWWIRGRGMFLSILASLLILMSVQATGKLLLYPLEIGVRFQDFDPAGLQGRIGAVAVISNGIYRDAVLNDALPSTSSFSRVKRAAHLAGTLGLPIFLSGAESRQGDQADVEFLKALLPPEQSVFVRAGAIGTFEHAAAIASMAREANVQDITVFVSGNHALRTQAALRAEGVRVPVVIVGVRDSIFSASDAMPSFLGFFYWKHALKEYMALAAYLVQGKLAFQDLFVSD